MPITERNFIDVLEDCLSRLDRGELLLDVLGQYPSHEHRLKPLLLIAMLSRALPQPVPLGTAIRKGKNRMLAEMNLLQAEKASRTPKSRQPVGEVQDGWLERMPNPFQPGQVGNLNLAYRLAIAAVVLVMGGSLITLTASASGLPGGVFTHIYNGLESVREVLLFNSNTIESLSSVEDMAEVADNLAGNPGEVSTKPGMDPLIFTEKSIPGLEDFSLPTKVKKDKVGEEDTFVDDDPYQEQEDLELEETEELENEEPAEEVKDEKIKKDKKDKDKIKKDKKDKGKDK